MDDGRDDHNSEDDDDRTPLIPPLGFASPDPGAAAPQHLAPPEAGATPAQHAPQHLSPPGADVAQTGPQHVPAPQHTPTAQSATSAQHLNAAGPRPQHLAGGEHAPEPTNPGNTGLQGPKHQSTGLRRFRHLSKAQIAAGSAAAAALIAAGAIVVSAQRDDPKTTAPPSTTAAPTPAAATATTVKRASVTPTTDPTATTATAAPTSTVAPTTTVTALPSGSGEYNVTSSPTHVSGQGFSQDVPSNANGGWVLVGACDGAGDCTITVLETGQADTFFTGADRNADGNLVFPMTPTGDGGYVNNFSVDSDGCTGTGSLTVVGVPQGQITAAYSLTTAASDSCGGGAVTIATEFTATRTG